MSGILVFILRLILAGSLYAFLGWTMLVLWRELKAQGIHLAERKAPTLDLAVQSSDGTTNRLIFQQSDLLIGRDPACDIRLNDDAVSARHIRLSFHHGQWWAEDLGSTNGTHLNQAALHTPTVLTTGDQLECGNTAIIVSIEPAVDPTPTTRL